MDTYRVLIVEDDSRIAQLHSRFTEKVDGFEVAGIANQLEEAEEMAAILEPDLVLLDLYLPDGSGMDLLRKLRAKGQQVDIILITAAKEVSVLQDALHGGALDYIIKPAVFTRFEEALHRFRQYRQQLSSQGELDQADIDQVLHATIAGTSTGAGQVPKGIDPLTLTKVEQVFDGKSDDGLSAEEVGALIGASRSTARRYLEHLVSVGFLKADVIYGSVGRPERKYFLNH